MFVKRSKEEIDESRRELLARIPFRLNRKLISELSSKELAFEFYFCCITSVFFLASFVIFVVHGGQKPTNEKGVDTAPDFIPAGQVVSIEVHHSAFSVDSTIKTDQGIYQLNGAVSANIGDLVKIRKYKSQSTIAQYKPHLCVESEIKDKCYLIH